ncbi:MAG: hypothetical protein AAB664_01530 [Patescibacteria group bacterium]
MSGERGQGYPIVPGRESAAKAFDASHNARREDRAAQGNRERGIRLSESERKQIEEAGLKADAESAARKQTAERDRALKGQQDVQAASNRAHEIAANLTRPRSERVVDTSVRELSPQQAAELRGKLGAEKPPQSSIDQNAGKFKAITPDMLKAAQEGRLSPDGSIMKEVSPLSVNDDTKTDRQPPAQQPPKKKGFFAGLFG